MIRTHFHIVFVLALVISKHNLCEGRSLSTTVFNSDIQLSFFFSFSWFISVCPFVALLKATYAENSHIVLSSRYYKNKNKIKKRSFLTSCLFRSVFMWKKCMPVRLSLIKGKSYEIVHIGISKWQNPYSHPLRQFFFLFSLITLTKREYR